MNEANVKPLTKKAQKETEKQKAIADLRKYLPPGKTVFTILRHVSKSGMMRHISLVVQDQNEGIVNITWIASKALGEKCINSFGHRAMKAQGAGMDMGFELVYRLSSVLYRDEFECIGKVRESHCPSNDHSNGDRNYGKHVHKSGGYALKHAWL